MSCKRICGAVGEPQHFFFLQAVKSDLTLRIEMHYTQQLYFHSKQGFGGSKIIVAVVGEKKLPKKLVDPVGNYLMEARLI